MTLEDAQRSIFIAKRSQKSGNLSDAFDNYQIGLGGYLDLYKCEVDVRKKKELGELIEVRRGRKKLSISKGQIPLSAKYTVIFIPSFLLNRHTWEKQRY